MRNKTQTLSPEQSRQLDRVVEDVRFALVRRGPVTVVYTTRAGEPRVSTGHVVSMVDSTDSTASFKIETKDGVKSVNTYNVTLVSIARVS